MGRGQRADVAFVLLNHVLLIAPIVRLEHNLFGRRLGVVGDADDSPIGPCD